MKHLLVLIAIVIPWSVALADSNTLWTGKVVNKTHGITGSAKLLLFEPGKLDAGGVRKVSGYLSVSGWLNGGGAFEGTISKGDLAFTTSHLGTIQWSGSFGLDSIVGKYVVVAQDGNPAEAGEFEVDKVARGGAADEFRQDLMLVIESDYNGIVKASDGKEHFTPQVVFDALHPVGTGISVQVNDLDLEWQESAKRTSVDGLRRYTTSLTLYWSSPLNGKGFTRLKTVHNAELGEMVSCEIMDTNGTTKAEAKETAKDLAFKIGAVIGTAAVKMLLESK